MNNNKTLVPRDLDILVTRITAKTVYYDLWLGRQGESWQVPAESTFDITQLEPGKRYKVKSKVIRSRVWSHKAQQHVFADRYDWVAVTEIPPQAKSTTRSAKQAEMARSLAEHPIANEDLFTWGKDA
ncbi:hypothetical protein WG922_13575 [Ramlibacter sp. AN1015]|uniref:hypothetical protein n=1 Tax=Ramlibacter sp. AN1015 TaxID=3133428 RepID=UPI0030C2719B